MIITIVLYVEVTTHIWLYLGDNMICQCGNKTRSEHIGLCEDCIKEIEFNMKKWCCYRSWMSWMDFGKIVKPLPSGGSCFVLYSEGQHYPPECWDMNYVKEFDTLEEAVEFYIKNRPAVDIRCSDFTDDEIRIMAKRKFPSYFIEKGK